MIRNNTARRLIAAASLLVAALPAYAVDASLLVYGGLYHFDGKGRHERGYNLNEQNPGLGLEFEQGGWLVGAGTYRDSFREQARMAYVGYRFTFGNPQGFHANVALKGGYMRGSGYDGLVALPTLGIGYRAFSLEATAFPSKIRSGGVVAFWLRYQF
ncbi:hypothetical protein KMB83_gp04 [Ralstonia phage Anchaing]|uniref:Outer membrane protein n=1 Tax=Ralstonia phage Anchaing TaxID=2759719 RepID=A0A7G5B8A1_9CAUD|nr:hypothetical protein KMB83_gp04 [Ralstonia phage Anchaing]QMV32524.1 hypothetical protein A1_00004 [Ralstonia phage Anchaing]